MTQIVFLSFEIVISMNKFQETEKNAVVFLCCAELRQLSVSHNNLQMNHLEN